MTHYQVELTAKVTETVTVEADNAEEAARMAERYSKLSLFSYADPRNTEYAGAIIKPLLTRDELNSALASGGH